jgi:hypothetical protein
MPKSFRQLSKRFPGLREFPPLPDDQIVMNSMEGESASVGGVNWTKEFGTDLEIWIEECGSKPRASFASAWTSALFFSNAAMSEIVSKPINKRFIGR